jgi:tetratricopeptide (TPR) repeat protein
MSSWRATRPTRDGAILPSTLLPQTPQSCARWRPRIPRLHLARWKLIRRRSTWRKLRRNRAPETFGNELKREKRFKEAEPYYLEALQNVDQLIRVDPADRRNQYLKAADLNALGGLYGDSGRPVEQSATLAQAEALSRDILKKWPGDLLVSDVLVSILVNQTQMERQRGQLDKARETCKRALLAAADLTARAKENKNAVSASDDLRTEARLLGIHDSTPASPGIQ